MTSDLASSAEREARKAEELPAFGGLKLLHIKRHVASLLGMIGRGGIFDQYTRHDISHIDKMIRCLDWLVPDQSRHAMTPSDWLMTVLSMYFHDLGMLVTPGEYSARNASGFPRYRDDVLFGGSDGADYRAKVLTLGADDAERFFYQEFVRHKHAERIRAWIMGQAKEHLGVAHEAMTEVSRLLEPLGQQFRRDLGLVCESHHLNDLGDLKKYKPHQPYGNSDAETVNLQYSAALLRTADLLHVTSDRTPSIEFRLINPTDPISQQEWAKQMAVTRVRPKLGLNEDGLPDEKAPKDTVEVHAYFTKEDGFFGLTSYLSYAAAELSRTHDWIATTEKLKLAAHEFPWRKIDDSGIETEGFIRDTFEFTLDQARILDLLTGHTLYNDTRVVLRELVQNAIDAVRIEHYPNIPRDDGHVRIEWDDRSRVLSVLDNGTGMTQRIITHYLLKVGTSRYQDPEFRKQYPQFSSISRFGIGVLSTFMIADSVEILTCHADEEQARQLTLRSVHGKYLIRLLDKSDPAVASVAPHGTLFRLKVRPSVDMSDVGQTAARWVVVPDCDVSVSINNGSRKRLGFPSPAHALASLLGARGIVADIYNDANPGLRTPERPSIRILAHESDGVSLAYAVEWNEYFREWGFLTAAVLQHTEEDRPLLGTCIEGIRIEFESPGFDGTQVLAIANVKGLAAPKTNVARSGIEATPERDSMLRSIYQMYVNHIAQEIAELHTSRSFSLTWATGEAKYLLQPLISEERFRGHRSIAPLSETLLEEALQHLPVLLVEDSDRRTTVSAKALSQEREFWTIECGLLRSAEPLIREAATSASLAQIIRALNVSSFQFPPGLVLCGTHPDDGIGRFAFRRREIDRIVIHVEQRRVDLRWVERESPPRWVSLAREAKAILERTLEGERSGGYRSLRRDASGLAVGSHSIEIDPKVTDLGIRVFGRLFLFPDTRIAQFVKPFLERAEAEPSSENAWAAALVTRLVQECIGKAQVTDPEELVRKVLRSFEDHWPLARGARPTKDLLDESHFVDCVRSTEWRVFDPSAWQRGWGMLGGW